MATNGSPGFQNGYFWWHGKVNVSYIYTQSQQPYIESLWHSQPQTLSLSPCFKKLVLKEWCHFLLWPPNHFLFWLVSKLVLSLCSFGTGNLHAHPVSLIQGQIAKLFLASGPLLSKFKAIMKNPLQNVSPNGIAKTVISTSFWTLTYRLDHLLL